MDTRFEIVPAEEVPLAAQAKAFTDAFAGYLIGSIELDTAGMARFLSAQGADLYYSRFAREKNGALAGFGFINRTGNIPRLAGMGTVPFARRSGIAAYLLTQLIEEAQTRRDEAMVLEVFEQNAPAVALYRRYGFKEQMQLFGWRHKNDRELDEANQLVEISLLAAAGMPRALDYPEIPWQISRFAVVKLPGRAFCIDDTCIVISEPDVGPIRVHSIIGNHRKDQAQNVLNALLAKFAPREFFAPQIFPEPFGTDVFEPVGFVREPLNQFLMLRNL
jgi:ribosomal protein S18 acetylase RimI-like enzyme